MVLRRGGNKGRCQVSLVHCGVVQIDELTRLRQCGYFGVDSNRLYYLAAIFPDSQARNAGLELSIGTRVQS
jgi:hypothetical protein